MSHLGFRLVMDESRMEEKTMKLLLSLSAARFERGLRASPPIVERRRGEGAHRHVRAGGDRQEGQGLRAARGAHRRLDNDGTLWSEQPLYFQFVFMLEQVRKAGRRSIPSGRTTPRSRRLAKQDHEALAKLGQKPILELMGAGEQRL